MTGKEMLAIQVSKAIEEMLPEVKLCEEMLGRLLGKLVRLKGHLDEPN